MKEFQKGHISQTVIFQLSTGVISVFVGMTLISNLVLNWYQTYLTEQLVNSLDTGDVQSKSSIIVDNNTIIATNEYRLFSIAVLFATILIGSILLLALIKNILRPFKQLADTVEHIDVDHLEAYQKELVLAKGTLEVKQLTSTFNQAFEKIYKSYNRQKQFSSDVAHELRLPLAVMRSRVDLFKKQNDFNPKKVKAFIDIIDQNVIRLNRLVESILLFSNEEKLIKSLVNLNQVIDESLSDLKDLIHQKDVTVTLNSPHITINSHQQLLSRVLYNIIENAIKYNHKGGCVNISAKEDDTQVSIKISDTGIGIAPSNKKQIVELFYRIDESRNSAIGSYGIGLSLVSKILKQLGGTIKVEDNDPKGTIFTIILTK